MDFGQQKKN